VPLIPLDKLEEILYRESAVIAPEDVPILMVTLHEEVGAEVPQRLLDEAEANNADQD
jgi:hypothetical protein